MSIYKKLQAIQMELKAPKNQYNEFGKFHYRSCEDILEAVKPLCQKHGAVLTISDSIMPMDGRHYVKASVCLRDIEDSSEVIFAEAYAREAEQKSGMDASQITGSASSYARKYALNGLFCIDDVKDADDPTQHSKAREKKEQQQEQQAWKKEGGKTYVLSGNGEFCELSRFSMKSLQKIVSDDKYKAIKWDIAKAIKEKQANE
jgi:hypothetical protein